MDASAWDERYAATELVWSAGPNAFLVAEAGDLPPGRALDVACGEGRNAIWLAEQGWEVVGVDFAGVAVEKARRLAEQRGVDVDWRQADVVAEPLPAGEFDLVAVLYLQLPVAERRRAFAKAADAVATGGTLLVVGHALSNLHGGWGGPKEPAVLYEPNDVVADVDGLMVLKAELVERHVDTAEGRRTAIDTLVRATRL